MQKLDGKVALVTGAARRIGANTVKELHKYGATVAIHYRYSSEAADALCKSLNAKRHNSCYILQAELVEVASLTNMIDQLIHQTGRLDILINNASSFYPTKIGKVTENDWDNLFASNLKAPLFLSQAAAPYLKQSKGCIINMIDIHAERPLAEHPVYCAAKAGLLMLTKSLAKELAPEIRVNGVSPGAILWPESNGNNESSTESEKIQNELLEKNSLKRQGTADDIAKAILFLLCDAPYITGHNIPVDGGRLLNQ